MRIIRSALMVALFLASLLGTATVFAQAPVASTNWAKVLVLTRTGEHVSDTNKVGKVTVAKRGLLQVDHLSFHTIERVGVVSLKKGTYECFMEQQHNPDGSGKRKVFRIQTEGPLGHKLKNGSGGPAAILIHVANYPHQLTGCIAPGRSKAEEGVNDSVEAMNEIFEACGGFVDGKKILLVVRK